MRNPVKLIPLVISLMTLGNPSFAQHTDHAMPHEMQHGFVLAVEDTLASHLVATGHHSRQTEIMGELLVDTLSLEGGVKNVPIIF